MKHRFLLASTLALGCGAQIAFSQNAIPGAPEDNGLKPKSDTVYIHDDNAVWNDSLEGSNGIAISSNGNIITGWEDDDSTGGDILDFEAVWTMFNSSGAPITPVTTINSGAAPGGPIDTTFLAYFRADNSPISGWTSWGPKIKANLFGDGVGMGATSFALGYEVPALTDTQTQEDGSDGDFPSVQLLTNDGQPVRIVPGVTDAYADRLGDIRIGDWEFLANGNILVVGESRQKQDLNDIYNSGGISDTHAIYRILKPDGTEAKSETLASEVPLKSEMWHGAAVTANGFALRFALNGVATARFFNNDGTPASGNIDLATLTGKAYAAGGGRGEGIGWAGNGKDAYVYAYAGIEDDGTRQVSISVINANGTLRWTKTVVEPGLVLNTSERVDAAIDEKGRVFVVFQDTKPNEDLGNPGVASVMGRLFDATGTPMGGTFFVSEAEPPSAVVLEERRPRVAWRNNLAAVLWETRNSPAHSGSLALAMRVFTTFAPGTVEGAGLARIVPDTLVNPQQPANSLDNWEPYASVLGNSHFLIEANTFADSSSTDQRFVVKVQPAGGGAGKLAEGFYADNGTPYALSINLSRQNGNPGRVAGDKRPGAVNYIVGGETSAHGFAEFVSTPNRWAVNDMFSGVNRYATVQAYALNPATTTSTPLTKAFDPLHGNITDAFSGNTPEVSRFGGEVVGLDNGNFVVVIDDRSNLIAPVRTPTVAVIKPDGTIVKAGFAPKPDISDQIWSNVAAYKGGFALRFQGVIYFYNNAGDLQGSVDQNTSGESTWDRGRGDGTRITSHINSSFVYLAGGNTPVGGKNTAVKVAAFDARTFAAAGIAQVAESSFPAGTSGYDRVIVASDALDRLVVAYESVPTGFAQPQTVVRVFSYNGTANAFTPLTSSFYPFVNSVPGTPTAPSTIRDFRPAVAMTTKQIMVAAKGEINLSNHPELGPDSFTQAAFYTVFSHPDPKEDPTPAVNAGAFALLIDRSGNNVTLTWTVDGVSLETASSLAVGAIWSPVTTTGKSYTTPSTGTAFYRLKKP